MRWKYSKFIVCFVDGEMFILEHDKWAGFRFTSFLEGREPTFVSFDFTDAKKYFSPTYDIDDMRIDLEAACMCTIDHIIESI